MACIGGRLEALVKFDLRSWMMSNPWIIMDAVCILVKRAVTCFEDK